MRKLILASALIAPAALAAPVCDSGSYEVGPYLGVGAQASKIKLHGGISARKSVQPYGFLGLKVHPNLAVELGTSLKDHKLKVQDIQHTETLGPLTVTYTEHQPITRSRKVDLRLIGNTPIDRYEDVQGLFGLGLSHLRLKQLRFNGPSASHSKLVPSVLAGVEFGTSTPLRLRLTASYAHGLKTGVSGVKARHNLSAMAGVVWHL